jgi:hypothetical protein
MPTTANENSETHMNLNATNKPATDRATINQPATADTATMISNWKAPEKSTHPQAAEIRRQIEYYFSEDNLRYDAHLWGLLREGNGTASLNEILGWPKMLKFKQRSLAKETVKQSTLIFVTPDGKRVGPREPPKGPPRVTPKIDVNRKKKVIPEDKPWLTKALLKPTGFEPNAADGPVHPAEYEQDRGDYDPEIAFTQRIDTAVARFTGNRKMHQETRAIFSKFVHFGGFDSGQQMFTGGGLSKELREELTAKEIAERTSYFGVSERVLDGLHGEDAGEITWAVDFEAVAKGYLSSQFMSTAIWYDEKQVKTATNVLRNFYTYLLLHDVCPEYKDQIMAARKICDLAEEELPKLAVVDKSLPGGFNVACSTLTDGNYAGLHAGSGDWVVEGDDLGWSHEDAKKVFLAAVAAYGTDEQLTTLEGILTNDKPFKVVSESMIGIEVTDVEFMTEQAKQVYNDPRLANTLVQPMGILQCKYWEAPHAPPMDLPRSVLEAHKATKFEFIIEEEMLKYFSLGMKFEVCVKELDIGIKWIDYLETSYATFFTWLANENIRDWKEPGPPKAWMERQVGGMEMVSADECETGSGGDEYEDGDDELPD